MVIRKKSISTYTAQNKSHAIPTTLMYVLKRTKQPSDVAKNWRTWGDRGDQLAI